MTFERKRIKAVSAPAIARGSRSSGMTISRKRLLEIDKEIRNLKIAARRESNPSELRFKVLMGARTIRQLVEQA